MISQNELHDYFRESMDYPDIFPMSSTHSEVPRTYQLYQSLGSPLGIVITPFINRNDRRDK